MLIVFAGMTVSYFLLVLIRVLIILFMWLTFLPSAFSNEQILIICLCVSLTDLLQHTLTSRSEYVYTLFAIFSVWFLSTAVFVSIVVHYFI